MSEWIMFRICDSIIHDILMEIIWRHFFCHIWLLNHCNLALSMHFTCKICTGLYVLIAATRHWNFQRLLTTGSHFVGCIQEGLSVTSEKVHGVLVNCLFKLAQEKVWLGELTSRNDHSCWLGTWSNKTNKQNFVGCTFSAVLFLAYLLRPFCPNRN